MGLGSILKNQIKRRLSATQIRTLRSLPPTILYGNDLRKLALAFGSDKQGQHFYAEHYQRHFQPFRKQRIKILEIGIGGYEDPLLGGCSLRTWKAYFPKGEVFGLDIHDKAYHNENRIKTFKGSQVDEAFLKSVLAETGGLDIIIDDGSHLNDHVITTFRLLFPLLKANGIYVIEDLQTSYWPTYGGDSNDLKAEHTSMNFLKSLVDGLNYEEFRNDAYVPSYFDKNIVAIHFYHNLVFIYKGDNSEGSNILGKRFT